MPLGSLVTDTDTEVSEFAIGLLQNLLTSGAIQIRRLTVQMCARCDHMVGLVSRVCHACGHTDTPLWY
jgi:hypothetical protein